MACEITSSPAGDKEADACWDRVENGRIRYQVPQVSKSVVGQYYSCDPVFINHFAWWIELGKHQDEKGRRSLSFWCKCQPSSWSSSTTTVQPPPPPDWKCFADLEFRLLPQDGDPVKIVSQSQSDVLTPEAACIGYYDFKRWNKVCNQKTGPYCKQDSITVEVIVREMHVFRVVAGQQVAYKHLLNQRTGKVVYDLRQTFTHLPSLPQADVLISFNDVDIMAHSALLIKGRYFRSLLRGQENRAIKVLLLPLPTNLPSLLLVLTFLYTNQLFLSSDTICDLVVTAHLMHLKSIVLMCLPLLQKRQILTLLTTADSLKLPDLMEQVWPLFRQHTLHVLWSNRFPTISYPLLRRLLQQEDLNCAEVDLLVRAKDWAVARCNKMGIEPDPINIRAALRDALFDIRWPHLEPRLLTRLRKRYTDLFTRAEWRAVRRFAKRGRGRTKLQRVNGKFKTKARSFCTQQETL